MDEEKQGRGVGGGGGATNVDETRVSAHGHFHPFWRANFLVSVGRKHPSLIIKFSTPLPTKHPLKLLSLTFLS